MKANQIKGIVNDLLDINSYRHPLKIIFLDKKFEINLIDGKMTYVEDYSGKDSLAEFYNEKREFFLRRIKDLKGNIKDFEEAKIIVFGKKEKAVIKYKGKLSDKEVII